VLIHTSFLDLKSDQIHQILTKYAKRMCVFVFVYVQVRICEKWTKTSQKPTKTSTRLEKGKKPKPRKKFIQEKPKMTKVILRDSENNKRDS
jgi:hypothetical protein